MPIDYLTSHLDEIKQFLLNSNVLALGFTFIMKLNYKVIQPGLSVRETTTQINQISTSMVNDIISPIINKIINPKSETGKSLKDLVLNIFGIEIKLGKFLEVILQFILIITILYIFYKQAGILDYIKKK